MISETLLVCVEFHRTTLSEHLAHIFLSREQINYHLISKLKSLLCTLLPGCFYWLEPLNQTQYRPLSVKCPVSKTNTVASLSPSFSVVWKQTHEWVRVCSGTGERLCLRSSHCTEPLPWKPGNLFTIVIVTHNSSPHRLNPERQLFLAWAAAFPAELAAARGLPQLRAAAAPRASLAQAQTRSQPPGHRVCYHGDRLCVAGEMGARAALSVLRNRVNFASSWACERDSLTTRCQSEAKPDRGLLAIQESAAKEGCFSALAMEKGGRRCPPT